MIPDMKTQLLWQGKFGGEYTDRNILPRPEMDKLYLSRYGISRSELNRTFIGNLPKDIRILEVGCGIGNQLLILQGMGFNKLYGIDIQPYTVELAKQYSKGINIIEASAFDIPFKDKYFDMVFTSGLLIHIPPELVEQVIAEILRCSNRYVWGYEYFSPDYVEVPYRGESGALWKADFASMFNLKVIKQVYLPYLDCNNVDTMYLLEKR